MSASSVVTPKLFRPSNGTHGDIFMAEWCENCAHFHDEETDEHCEILSRMFCLDVDEDGYPAEVVEADNSKSGGKCTAWTDKHNGEKTYRCKKTPDLFGVKA